MAELELVPAPSFSYASDEVRRISQRIIRGIEKITGQPRIRRLYEDYTKLGRPPELFWGDAAAALRLDVDLTRGSIRTLPATGPQIVIANHPFGVVDGIILCWLVSQIRSDFYVWGGETRTMKQHGFARSLPWTVLDESTRDGAPPGTCWPTAAP